MRSTELDSQFPVFIGHGLGDGFGFIDAGHERQSNSLITIQWNDAGFRVRSGFQHGQHRLDSHSTAQDTVKSRWIASALDVTQNGYSRVVMQIRHDDLFDHIGRNGIAITIDGSFRNDDDIQSLTWKIIFILFWSFFFFFQYFKIKFFFSKLIFFSTFHN